MFYLQAYGFYMDGFLPSAGSPFEQSIKVMEAIKHIQAVAKRIEKEKE